MLAGMGLHYAAFRKLEQVHRGFMDEKDRIITAIYNDTRARARANRARLQQERLQRQQPAPPDLPRTPGSCRGPQPLRAHLDGACSVLAGLHAPPQRVQ